MNDTPPLTPQLLLRAYRHGLFPMSHSRHDEHVHWYSPDPRAILPLDNVKFSRSLLKRVRRGDYRITHDQAFEAVIRGCAAPRLGAADTWISEPIIRVFTALHTMGYAHSVEAWAASEAEGGEERLVGGLYGIALGRAFFGESMFSRATDASKVCLVHLVEHLRAHGFTLLDVQFNNPHMAQFGVVEIPRREYLARLQDAVGD